jgi:hypothetical protein
MMLVILHEMTYHLGMFPCYKTDKAHVTKHEYQDWLRQTDAYEIHMNLTREELGQLMGGN